MYKGIKISNHSMRGNHKEGITDNLLKYHRARVNVVHYPLKSLTDAGTKDSEKRALKYRLH